MIMVRDLPAGCRLTAIFDVSNIESSSPHLNVNLSVGMPLWLGTRYEFIILCDAWLTFLSLDLPYTVRASHQVDYTCSAIAYV